MPVLRHLSDFDPENMFDGDSVPRDLVTFGADGIVMADLHAQIAESLNQQEEDFHCHRKSQLVLLLRGVLTCEVARDLWLVPPQSAIWVPAGTVHRIEAVGTLQAYVAYVAPHAATGLPSRCCMLGVTPLLRELILRSADMPVLYAEGGLEAHLVTLLLDELAQAPVGNLHLPMPADARLRRVVTAITSAPDELGTLHSWAQRVGMSERSFARLMERETGMSFGRWRQQLHLLMAVKWLEAGAPVQQVALDLGYESPGSFVTMFRKAMGSSPARYIADRRSTNSSSASITAAPAHIACCQPCTKACCAARYTAAA
ncbi:MAG: HTH-type transcriptional regulator NimR [Stenotrophomonas maltophilia]|uniref:HTH-type transcriptional regulator NimR n=1 Tax=Stenotrophomonas maltophilia TaxID=40324 RepID=A0A7V8JNJ4_STEMA|nr:MAG: HTH-type transcriptional regulator NimR [Stenotrophomonas maltophilia]